MPMTFTVFIVRHLESLIYGDSIYYLLVKGKIQSYSCGKILYMWYFLCIACYCKNTHTHQQVGDCHLNSCITMVLLTVEW